MEDKKWPRLPLSLPPDLKKKIRKEARLSRKTMSQWIRDVLEDKIN